MLYRTIMMSTAPSPALVVGRSWVRVLGGMVVAVAAMITMSAPAAAAQAMPPVVAAQPAISAYSAGDGCTNAPDGVGRAGFETACADHDACYESGTSRLECDKALRDDIRASCTSAYADLDGEVKGPGGRAAQADRDTCLARSDTYFSGVRTYGRQYYVGSGDRS